MSLRRAPTPNALACPGIKDLLRPTMSYVKCNSCGGSVEIWSDEDEGICLECGATWKKPEENASCLSYCEYADKCRELIKTKQGNAK